METRNTTLKSLSLADAFGIAVTGFEVWRFAPDKAEPLEVLEELERLVDEEILFEEEGHFVFSGRENLIEERLMQTHLIATKRRRASRWARAITKLPYVRGVFAYGSLATGHVKDESDLDVLVVVDDGRIFTGRLIVSAFLEIFGVRRTDSKVKNQVCLNHFVIDSELSFPEDFRSPFSAWLWARMFPLALATKDKSLGERFILANDWVREFFPNIQIDVENSREGNSGKSYGRLNPISLVERALGKVQLKRIANHPKTKEGKGRIVANDREMIFHPSLPEGAVMSRLDKRLESLGLK